MMQRESDKVRSLDELRKLLRENEDPGRQADLISELYEALDEYSMDVSEAAWGGGWRP